MQKILKHVEIHITHSHRYDIASVRNDEGTILAEVEVKPLTPPAELIAEVRYKVNPVQFENASIFEYHV